MELTNLAMARRLQKRKFFKIFIIIRAAESKFQIACFTLLSLVLGMIAATEGQQRIAAMTAMKMVMATTTTIASPAKAETETVKPATTPTTTTATTAMDFIILDKNQISINETSLAFEISRATFSNDTESFFVYHYDGKVNAFWLQFAPPPPIVYYTFAIVYIFLFIVGCGGNLLVIFMFYKHSNLLTPATTLVLNLAISDFIMLVKCPVAIYNNYMLGPALGDIGCRIYGFLGGLSGTASILTLTAIAVDRYCVVVHPLNPLRNDNNFRPIFMIIFIWIYSGLFSIIPAIDIGLSTYVPEGMLTTCSFDYLDRELNARIFMFTFFVCAYIIPLSIILFCYFYILKVVCNSDRLQACRNRVRTEQKLAMVIVVVILVWFLAWTPYSIVAMLGVFGQQDRLTPLASMVPAIFCKTSACIDPYIYAATQPRFRIEFRRFLNRSLGVRRLSMIGSSFRTRSTAAAAFNIRKRSAGDLTFDANTPPHRRVSDKLGAIIEEDNNAEEVVVSCQDADNVGHSLSGAGDDNANSVGEQNCSQHNSISEENECSRF